MSGIAHCKAHNDKPTKNEEEPTQVVEKKGTARKRW